MSDTSDTPRIRWVYIEGGGTWPIEIIEADRYDIAWQLRYAEDDAEDDAVGFCLAAATMIEAYRHLILLPQKKRNAVCKALKAAMGP